MNLKNLTKIVALSALLVTGIPMIAMKAPQWFISNPQAQLTGKRVNLFIQNNTDYDFVFQKIGSPASVTLKAHAYTPIDRLPLSSYINHSQGTFSLSTRGTNLAASSTLEVKVGTTFANNQVTGLANLYLNTTLLQQSSAPATADHSSNEFNVFITLNGNEENRFKDSTITSEITSEIR